MVCLPRRLLSTDHQQYSPLSQRPNERGAHGGHSFVEQGARAYAERSCFSSLASVWAGFTLVRIRWGYSGAKKSIGRSDGIHSDGTEQVGEARAHSIDPTMSAAQSANGRLRDRRSKDSISIQIYATRPTPCPRRSSLNVISALMLNVSVVDRWRRSVAAFWGISRTRRLLLRCNVSGLPPASWLALGLVLSGWERYKASSSCCKKSLLRPDQQFIARANCLFVRPLKFFTKSEHRCRLVVTLPNYRHFFRHG